MSERQHWRVKLVCIAALALLSGVSMLWLFWHHPIVTAVVTVGVVASFGFSARVARLAEPERADRRRFTDSNPSADLTH